MKNIINYLSIAPVISFIWFFLTSSILIEVNRFFPDSLTF